MMFFTLPTFLFSIVLSVLAAPALSPRIDHSGRGTFFYPGLGNCGGWNTASDAIVAISVDIYGNGGNCGQWVFITNTDNGRTTYAQVQDSCVSCAPGSLDMSPSAFQNLADLSVGDIPIVWHYMNRAWSPS